MEENNHFTLPRLRDIALLALLSVVSLSAQGASSYAEDPGSAGDGSYTVGPEYKVDPDLTDRGNPKGKSFEFAMRLALFRRLIAYSGTFVDQQDDDASEKAKYALGAWEYHSAMKLIETSDKKPLRVFTHVSENDLQPRDSEETHDNWVMAGASARLRPLRARGIINPSSSVSSAKHCDCRVFEQRLADTAETLVWIWRGYHPD